MFNSLEEETENLEKVVRDLRRELAAANHREESLNETINSLRAQDEKWSLSIRRSDFHILTCFLFIRRKSGESRESRTRTPS